MPSLRNWRATITFAPFVAFESELEIIVFFFILDSERSETPVSSTTMCVLDFERSEETRSSKTISIFFPLTVLQGIFLQFEYILTSVRSQMLHGRYFVRPEIVFSHYLQVSEEKTMTSL